MDEEILGEGEGESLQNEADSTETPLQAAKPSVTSTSSRKLQLPEKVVPYDFKRPERVGKEQMRALQTLHEGFSRNFAASLSGLIRSMVDVRLVGVDQMTYSEFVFGLENPTCFNVLRAAPLEGNIILDINPSVIFPLLDRLLGGGKEKSPQLRRPLTELEMRLVNKMTRLFLSELHKAWENVVKLTLSIERVESNPHLVSIVPPNEVVVLISFELSLGELLGMMNLCIPYNSIERIAGRLTANTWQAYGKRAATDFSRNQLARRLAQSEMELSVTLAESTVTMSELLGLKVGDIITTDHDIGSPLEVMLGDQRKFEAQAGALKGKKAIQITQVVEPQSPVEDPLGHGTPDGGST